jgi:DNA-binding XRE family transcriptional regulator
MCAILWRMFTLPHHSMPKRNQESTDLALLHRRIFARNFKQARKESGLTQDALSKITGLTQAFISNVENAKDAISLDNANILADAVGQPLRQLLTPPEK